MLNWIVLNRTDYLHKMDLTLNNLQRLIYHETQQTNQPFKPFDCVKINEYCWMKYFVLDSNACNHFTTSKQMINIE